MNGPVNRAFTLFELLCCVSIITLLVAILLPAVQSARESARSAECQNNLRQLSLAMLHHENVFGFFQEGYRFATPSKSFVPQVLPFVEQNAIPYDLTKDWSDPANRVAIQCSLAVLACPSSPQTSRIDDSIDPRPATTDYTVFHGVNHGYCDLAGWAYYSPPDENGIMTSRICRISWITDGTSQTVLFVEDAGRPKLWRMGRPASGVAGAGGWSDPNNEIALDGSDLLTTGGGQGNGLCVMNCTNDNEVYAFHPQRANFAFADGHVDSLSDRVDADFFASLVTRAAGD